MSYARPHLQTHNRKNGHSAVRGAAYRLGVDMVDERTGELCQFASKGQDNVAARWHLANDSAPQWQRDPALFWNAVEAGEKRKDSQVARDFRIPVPLGFDQAHAEKLALAVASRLRAVLNGVPMSVGLHHDNRRDAFGYDKDPESVGFHAHIYMPTRGVEMEGMAARKEGVFLELGNKNKSGVIVERFNEIWANEATILAHAQGLDTTYDHRSNVRQGINRKPQPRLGQQVVAMERRGLTTDRGDMFQEHVAAHPIPDTMSHAAALADIAREKKTLLTRIPHHDRPTDYRPATRAPTLDRSGIDAARVRSGRDGDKPLLAVRALNRSAVGVPAGGAYTGAGMQRRTFATLRDGGLLRSHESGHHGASEALHLVHREILAVPRAPGLTGKAVAPSTEPSVDSGLAQERQQQEVIALKRTHADAKAALAVCLANAQSATTEMADASNRAMKLKIEVGQWGASWKRRQRRVVDALEHVQAFEKRFPLLSAILRAVGLPLPGEGVLASATEERNAAMRSTQRYQAVHDEAKREAARTAKLVNAAQANIESARHAVALIEQQAWEMKERHRFESLSPEQRDAERKARGLQQAALAAEGKAMRVGGGSKADLVRAKPGSVRARAPQTPLAKGLQPPSW